MKAMETTAYYAFGVPLYALLIWIEARRAKGRAMPLLTFPECIGNLSAGLGTIVLGLFLGPVLILLYDWAYRHFALIDWEGGWQAWILALVLADFGHYCHHRFDHGVAACWAVHGVHHQPEQMNYTVAMRHAWFSDLYSFPFYVWLPLAGVPTAHFFIATTILSVHALITHKEQFRFPSLGIFVTPQSHILHHAKNGRYLNKNFGAMLCLWDRLFGTHVTLDASDPPVYGAMNGYETHDGVLSQWVLVRDLLHLCRQARTWRARLATLFGPPGTAREGAIPFHGRMARASTAIGRTTKIYVLLQFVLTLTVSLFIFIPRDDYAWHSKLAMAMAILAALSTLGGLLDGRAGAWKAESWRCLATAPLLLYFFCTPGIP